MDILRAGENLEGYPLPAGLCITKPREVLEAESLAWGIIQQLDAASLQSLRVCLLTL